MKKITVIGIDGKKTGEIETDIFSFSVRKDLIKRAVIALQANRRQSYGTNLKAGLRTSAHYHGVKDKRYSMKNREIARGPRSHNTSSQQEWRMRKVPQAVSGRKAHPPKVEKKWKQKINKKELTLALRSAISATSLPEYVKKRGHLFSGELPIIIDDGLEGIKKTSELKKFILTLKLDKDAIRAKKKKIRPGKGKMRGRKYKKKKSVLFVVSNDNGISNATKNVPGTDTVNVKSLNIEVLAPGTEPGRLTIWTKSAVEYLNGRFK